MAAALAELVNAGQAVPSLTPEMIPPMRANAARMVRLPPEELSRNATFDVVELYAPGRRDAPDVRLLICRPTAVAGTVPVIYWIHGGGMIAGTNQVGIDEALDYAEHLQAAVVPVEYRLAPEHPHPAPVEDCYTGLLWTVEHAEQFGFDPTDLSCAESVRAVDSLGQ
ncbi:hypothetical protein GCM10009576_085840 [Streptomyces rhizosphaericus]|uniref:Alpha/beta hydrolase fold-3 domain-containing protein n=1 Tax=Streptomyces rhizosphaericus TaxID=114699 RepID=A0ABN1SNP2_9ACTN